MTSVARVGGQDAAESVDQLIARVAGRLRGIHAPLPEEHLRGMAEEVVLDAVRFVLGWVEAPAGDAASPGGRS